MILALPYPPSANRYWRIFRGRAVHGAAAREYLEQVDLLARDARLVKLHDCVRVWITLHPVLPKDWAKRERKDARWALGVRRIDVDNAGKVALDALQGVAYNNDRQVTDYRARLGAPIPNGGLTVEITPDPFWESPL